ncbi:MAG: ABC transporter ATP-binding protein [Arachnia sp.]
MTQHPPESPPAAALIARDIGKSYPLGEAEIEILHGVSLTLWPQQIVAVMGPSGSGKSTLLYCLAGLEAPTAGDVILAGSSLGARSRTELARLRRRQVGFVFQSYNLIPTLTARENVLLSYTLDRRKPAPGLADQVLAAVGIEGRADARPPSMSGGEQQRVALARVLAQQPEIIFADEPTGALDTSTGERVLAELVRIAHSPGRCVLVVTHDPRVAAACDRVVFISDGRLVDEIAPASAAEVATKLAGLEDAARTAE